MEILIEIVDQAFNFLFKILEVDNHTLFDRLFLVQFFETRVKALKQIDES